MWASTFGNRRNTLGSVSIAVETGLPVLGHLIITELMVDPLRIGSRLAKKSADRDRRKTWAIPVDKVEVITQDREPMPGVGVIRP